jgi:hypothetical protein
VLHQLFRAIGPDAALNPDYLAWLLSLPLLERERLRTLTTLSAIGISPPPTEFNDPDWTVGINSAAI